ncbi:MAG: TetR family transcriptional regulator [Mycobacteriaceae bacterium]|nr:TetR family transcriptional regulator [Mycobacteriaceae bacterium]
MPVTNPPSTSRAERKEHTRRALLDGTLALAAERGFGAVSLREVARSAGIVPTAFYRHFASLDALGLMLVDEAILALRTTLRAIRRSPAAADHRQYVNAVFDHVGARRELVGFLVRERHGGSGALHRAIEDGLHRIAAEFAVDLSRFADQDPDTLDIVAELMVSTMADRVAVFLDTAPADAPAVIARTERQMRVILLGMRAWQA